MTCIVAVKDKDKVYMGCDTQTSMGSEVVEIETKIVKKEIY